MPCDDGAVRGRSDEAMDRHADGRTAHTEDDGLRHSSGTTHEESRMRMRGAALRGRGDYGAAVRGRVCGRGARRASGERTKAAAVLGDARSVRMCRVHDT
jgi:hypothetical protein